MGNCAARKIPITLIIDLRSVTGVTPRGTFVRVLQPHIEGLLVQAQGVDVGDRLRVKLVRTDVQRGYIDFARS